MVKTDWKIKRPRIQTMKSEEHPANSVRCNSLATLTATAGPRAGEAKLAKLWGPLMQPIDSMDLAECGTFTLVAHDWDYVCTVYTVWPYPKHYIHHTRLLECQSQIQSNPFQKKRFTVPRRNFSKVLLVFHDRVY